MASEQISSLPWSPNHESSFIFHKERHYTRSKRKWTGTVTLPSQAENVDKKESLKSWTVENKQHIDSFRFEENPIESDTPVPPPAPPPSLKPQYSLYRIIMTHDYMSRSVAPTRGLFNTNNMCFFNSVLQSLIHCSSFYALLEDIYANVVFSMTSRTPVLDALVIFAHNYASVGVTKPMSAEEFYSVICNHPKFHVQRDRQEDAQEFLAYLLDELESNFANANPSDEDAKDDLKTIRRGAGLDSNAESEWLEVGQGSKTVQTQHAGEQDLDNPIQELFGGRLRSVLLKKGSRQPSITTEPFLQVPLDISSNEVNSIQKAVDHLLSEEHLMLGSVPATKHIEFERMPPVLIMHLKRFTFINLGGSFDFGKITKPIAIEDTLRIECGFEEAIYSPFAVVYHHGPTATRGHYTTEVLVDGIWHHIDDDQVISDWLGNGSGHSLADEESKAVYMVFYERKAHENANA